MSSPKLQGRLESLRLRRRLVLVLRAVVFSLDAVLAVPSIATTLDLTEETLALPRLSGAAQLRSCFPPTLCGLVHSLVTSRSGFTACILTNNWVDDSTQRGSLAQLRLHFDFLIELCHVGMAKPEPQSYKLVLDTLQASPSEVVFLDDIKANLKPVCDLGIATILVQDTSAALRELEKVTSMQLLNTAIPLPTPCKLSDMSHGYVPIKPGVRLHFVELGTGPVVCLCHGFPESWFSWRYQIPALAQAGFRVLAVDMKGYGESSSPHEIEEYSLEVLCKEMITFLDKLGISQAVFIGHDWGGMLVWYLALCYPERVRAVASLNTPFRPMNPEVTLMETIKANPLFDYQLYFQKPGVAEAELEKNLTRTFKCLFRRGDESLIALNKVSEMGGILVQFPDEPSLSTMITEEEIQFYVEQFKKSGFRGPLNWYRNMDRNWCWGCKSVGRKILIPALMLTAEKDFVLLPEMSKHMEDWIPHLKRGHIKDCGHWTQMDRPTELNQILIEWLETDARDPPMVS
ncbi:bifunctional epoxide hydrolase 2 [Trichechus inunguis]